MRVLRSFQFSRIILYCAGFESYIRFKLELFSLLTRIVYCLAKALQHKALSLKLCNILICTMALAEGVKMGN